MGLLVLAFVSIFIGVSFLYLSESQLRRIYPGWSWVESKMWASAWCNNTLLKLVGSAEYQVRKEAWLSSKKEAGK